MRLAAQCHAFKHSLSFHTLIHMSLAYAKRTQFEYSCCVNKKKKKKNRDLVVRMCIEYQNNGETMIRIRQWKEREREIANQNCTFFFFCSNTMRFFLQQRSGFNL